MIRFLLPLALALAVLVATGPKAGAEPITPELRAVLDTAPPDEELSVIVSFSDRVNPQAFRLESKQDRRRLLVEALQDQAQVSQAGLGSFLRARGGRRIKELWIRNALAVTAPAAVIDQLETWPGVESIVLDQVIQAPTPVLGAAALPEWNIDMIGAPALWAMGHTGQGVVVANMDTGVDDRHDDLQGRWRGGSNSWYDPNGQHATPFDAAGHGTQTMGVMLGGEATGTAIGVAPGAKWIAVKIFNDQGSGSFSAIHLGFQWLLDPDGNPATDDAPDIVNNSWSIRFSEGQCNTAFLTDIQMLKAAGIAVVFAAGNSGPGTSSDTSPANNSGSFAVGAVSQSGAIANFSSRGPSACGGLFPHLAAPGANIKSSDLTNGVDFNAFNFVNGTSFASPHSAGALALLMGAFPGATVAQLESALVNAAVDLGASGPDNVYGNGLLDVAAAFNALGGNSDADGDGFTSDVDCNDNDASIHPGAKEIKRDGIDQDCNGFDLTIRITKARYIVAKDKFIVHATSALGANANLRVRIRLRDGTRVDKPMIWNGTKGRWQKNLGRFVERFGSKPKSVRVRGPEGAVSKSVTIVR